MECWIASTKKYFCAFDSARTETEMYRASNEINLAVAMATFEPHAFTAINNRK